MNPVPCCIILNKSIPRTPSPLSQCASANNLVVDTFLSKIGLNEDRAKEIHSIFLEYFSEGNQFSNVEVIATNTQISFSIQTIDPNYLMSRVRKMGLEKLKKLGALFTPSKVATEECVTMTMSLVKAEDQLAKVKAEIALLEKQLATILI